MVMLRCLLGIVSDSQLASLASLLFSGLMALYILFFNFCRDLNGPFSGVYQIKRSNAVSHLMQTKWLIVNQLGDAVSFSVDYDGEPQTENMSFLGNGSEDIATVEAETMQKLVNELESSVETMSQDNDLCDAVLPGGTTSLDCANDGREARLLQLQEELGRLKNQQLINGDGVPSSKPDPAARLHQMEGELGRLKQLRQSITNGDLSM